MPVKVRKAEAGDLDRITLIYNQGIAARTATFETEPRTASDIADWLSPDELLLVVERDDVVAGFARTSSYRSRPCYAGIREFSVYVEKSNHGSGLARSVMSELIGAARGAGITKLIARIFKENTGSLALCDKLGFRRVGTYEKHGKLDGEWRDCVIVELLLIDGARGTQAPFRERSFS